MKHYGKELVLDLHLCNSSLMTRKHIEDYFIHLCNMMNMERCDLHWWDDEGVPEEDKQTDPKLVGISAIQFIITSNITIHTLPLFGSIYINIFSCKSFNYLDAKDFSVSHFSANKVHSTFIYRTMADEVA